MIQLQYNDHDRGEWKFYKLSNINHDHESIIVGGKFRLLVDGVVIYPPEEVGKQDD